MSDLLWVDELFAALPALDRGEEVAGTGVRFTRAGAIEVRTGEGMVMDALCDEAVGFTAAGPEAVVHLVRPAQGPGVNAVLVHHGERPPVTLADTADGLYGAGLAIVHAQDEQLFRSPPVLRLLKRQWAAQRAQDAPGERDWSSYLGEMIEREGHDPESWPTGPEHAGFADGWEFDTDPETGAHLAFGVLADPDGFSVLDCEDETGEAVGFLIFWGD